MKKAVSAVTNVLTFDIEDWHPLADEWIYGVRGTASGWVPKQVDTIRRLLDRHQTRATFFWLGWTAESCAGSVIALQRDGHEIASHGYSHRPVYAMSPAEFEADVLKAQDVLASITGQLPRGFRAPQFSINQGTWWALGVLARLGFRYDSSIFPIHHRRYGFPDFGRRICPLQTENGPILELPLSTVRWGGINLPVAGGGYFRLLPQAALLGALRRLNSERLPFTAYFHPYEYHQAPLSLSSAARGIPSRARIWLFESLQNLGRSSVPRKLDALLSNSSFQPCSKTLEEVGYAYEPR